MEVRLEGTGGPEGWPVPGCPCASCGRLAPGHRRPSSIVLDGRVRLAEARPAAGYVIRETADGREVTGPDGGRLLYAAGPATGSPRRDADAPFDVVLMDLPDRPERLGDLRRRGRVTPATRIIAVHLDHRVPAESELARRLGFWGAAAVPDGTVVHTASAEAPPWVRPRRTLLLGGSRSGKSEEAELRLAAEPEVTYVATGPSGGDDPAWLARVRAHRERRPAHWQTIETTDLVSVLSCGPRTLLVDGIGTWLAAVFDECAAWPDGTASTGHRAALDRVAERCDALTAAWRGTRARVVAVSDEVGLGVIPATPAGRLFRDALGRLNQALARESEDVALVVSGRVVPLPL
ncbi:bifunctional adenosylcobinamide kinase/adenosylcobinamide-phosphate guanylyltransferase [Microbispora hainanensis]|uniref:Adenosylcobinamide kinase n=1 Tax=Microbispora hainanensis TaxID=568844 RepID=A0A544Z3K4_9ACTN|nr:bifunctional adenosylcobinamide kinase/adenosylcobinamide-phosphate guanylyltransferase [Microbispora hainanensis]TQS23608.1 bifunctional adenosylcobinamide kinase/adenosylcobinamide-phosphate guanylyltransferase [Microbispora hainanensis]